MKGIILAAGLGTRLRPFTLTHPKALVKLCGTPMLERVIARLKRHGITDITVNVHHFAGQIREFLKENNDFGVTIHVSDETDMLRDTGGGILHAAQFLEGDEPVVLQNADIYTDFDLNKMIESHLKSGADVTILGEERDTKRYLFYDGDNRLRGWGNIATGEVRPEGFDMTAPGLKRRAYGCVQIFNPSAMLPLLRSYSPDEHKFGIFPFYIDNCNLLDIRNFTPDESYRWFDIGRPESIARAEEVLTDILKQ